MVTAQTKFCVDSSHRHVTTVLCFADVFFSRFSFSHFTTLKFYAAHSIPTFSFPHIFSICAWSACLCACLFVITMNCAIKWLILSRCHLRRGLVSLGNHVFAVGPYHPAGRGSFGGSYLRILDLPAVNIHSAICSGWSKVASGWH